MAEARAASALNHPNIVTVFDAAFDGDTPYIVSELIEGRTLREEMAKGALAAKRVLDLATHIADGRASSSRSEINPSRIRSRREPMRGSAPGLFLT